MKGVQTADWVTGTIWNGSHPVDEEGHCLTGRDPARAQSEQSRCLRLGVLCHQGPDWGSLTSALNERVVGALSETLCLRIGRRERRSNQPHSPYRGTESF